MVPSDSSYKFKQYVSPSFPLCHVIKMTLFSFSLYPISLIPVSMAFKNPANFSFSWSIILGRKVSSTFLSSQKSLHDHKDNLKIKTFRKVPKHKRIKWSSVKLYHLHLYLANLYVSICLCLYICFCIFTYLYLYFTLLEWYVHELYWIF